MPKMKRRKNVIAEYITVSLHVVLIFLFFCFFLFLTKYCVRQLGKRARGPEEQKNRIKLSIKVSNTLQTAHDIILK